MMTGLRFSESIRRAMFALVTLLPVYVALIVSPTQAQDPPDDVPRPFRSPLITEWGARVTPENAWREYPRPQLRRSDWTNLNGQWDYAVTPRDQETPPSTWQGKILVPFCLESKLGGVQRLLQPDEALWYRRRFTVPEDGQSGRILLHFEAVDYACQVWVNGKPVGRHRGGHTPFSFDITEVATIGDNQLTVRVVDETEGWQLRGKQVLKPRGIWYTRVSGIWQTVWLETVGNSYIEKLDVTTDGKSRIEFDPTIRGIQQVHRIVVEVRDGDEVVTRLDHEFTPHRIPIPVIEVPNAKQWSPDSPHLYDLTVRLVDRDGNTLDKVESYVGIRSVGSARDADGHLRFTLNGKFIFHFGPLDQGWWPDGLLTPPSDEALQSDIKFLKAAGFNMIRKHIKVEPRRFYYHCDRLGMMVWQDHVSDSHNAKWTRMAPNPKDADWPDEHHRQFLTELERMIEHLSHHPCIVVWVPFNEAWSQHRTVEVGRFVKKVDPTRLVNIASGGNFWPVGDIADHHNYPDPAFPFDLDRFGNFIKVVGEFGGHGLVVPGHIWDPNRRNWGYGGLPKNAAEYRERYIRTLKKLNELRARGIAAGVYTQTSDVEGEVNGLLTYDRKVAKLKAKELAELHRKHLTLSPAER